MILAAAGCLIGAPVQFGFGYRLGQPLVQRMIRSHGRWLLLRESDLNRADRLFNRSGGLIVLVGHLSPGVRGLVSLPAGMGRMPLQRFVLFTAVGAGARGTLQGFTGSRLGQHWPRLLLVVEEFEWLRYLAVAAVVALGLVRVSGAANRYTLMPYRRACNLGSHVVRLRRLARG